MKGYIYLIIASFLLGSLFIAGCTTQTPSTSKTTIPSTVIPTTVQASSLTKSPIQTSIPTTTIALKYFNGNGISFGYPSEFQSLGESSLQSMRGIMAQQGVELITVLRSSDGRKTIQIARQPNPASIDALYMAKKQVTDQVNAQGMELMGTKFVKYTIERVRLSPNQEAVLGYAEDTTGKTGINYAIPVKGYEYAVMFLYTTSSDAKMDSSMREQLIESVQFH